MSTPDPIPALQVPELDVEAIKARVCIFTELNRAWLDSLKPSSLPPLLCEDIPALIAEVERLRALVPLPATPTEVACKKCGAIYRPDPRCGGCGAAALPVVQDEAPPDTPKKCPTCESPQPHLHPSMQPDGGEVQPCGDPWHKTTPTNWSLVSAPRPAVQDEAPKERTEEQVEHAADFTID